MNERLIAGLSLALVLLAAGCDDRASGSVVATREQNGRRVVLETGEKLVVELDGNPTTGYQWTVAQIEPAFLRDLGSAYEADSSALGSGGTYTFRFEALQPGTTELVLAYRRAWETTPDDETYSLSVDIQGIAVRSADTLDGTQWKLASWSAGSPDPSGFDVTADFEDGQISGRSGVNLYGGPCSASRNGSFSVGLLAMTEMAGEPDAMQVESLYHGLLAQVRRWRIDPDRLVLSDADGRELLVFHPQ